jgi:hypothetical protein
MDGGSHTNGRALWGFVGLLIADEPGKQVSSAIKIKNVSRSHVAFKVSSVEFMSHCFVPDASKD